MNVTEKLEFSNASTDLIIDKGLFDSILCGEAY